MLYCRDKIYPLGLPNGVSHVLTAIAVCSRRCSALRASFLPPQPSQVAVSWRDSQTPFGPLLAAGRDDARQAAAVERTRQSQRGAAEVASRSSERPASLLRAFFAIWSAGLAEPKLRGVHFEEGDEISIEGEQPKVILDGETFRAEHRQADPPASWRSRLSFVRIAA